MMPAGGGQAVPASGPAFDDRALRAAGRQAREVWRAESEAERDRLLLLLPEPARLEALTDPEAREVLTPEHRQQVQRSLAAALVLGEEWPALRAEVAAAVEHSARRVGRQWLTVLDRRTSIAVGLAVGAAFVTGCPVGAATMWRLVVG